MGPVDENGLSAGDHGFPGFEDHNDWKTRVRPHEKADRRKRTASARSLYRSFRHRVERKRRQSTLEMAKGVRRWSADDDRELIAG